MKQLNLPPYSFRITENEGSQMIFDKVRRKYVKLTPEEWVRQNFVQYLIDKGEYPPGLIIIEKTFKLNKKLIKRADILVHDRKGRPVLIVECKADDIEIDDSKVRDQAGEYNKEFKVPYVVVTNGMKNYAFRFYPDQNVYEYLTAIPLYGDLLT